MTPRMQFTSEEMHAMKIASQLSHEDVVKLGTGAYTVNMWGKVVKATSTGAVIWAILLFAVLITLAVLFASWVLPSY